MEKTLKVINKMVEAGVLEAYAIGGAIAAIFYVEPFATSDLDIFFVANTESKFTLLSPLYNYLSNLGYHPKGEFVNIVRAEHPVAIMLQTGRAKDYARISLFMEQQVINSDALFDILTRHGLLTDWQKYLRKFQV